MYRFFFLIPVAAVVGFSGFVQKHTSSKNLENLVLKSETSHPVILATTVGLEEAAVGGTLISVNSRVNTVTRSIMTANARVNTVTRSTISVNSRVNTVTRSMISVNSRVNTVISAISNFIHNSALSEFFPVTHLPQPKTL